MNIWWRYEKRQWVRKEVVCNCLISGNFANITILSTIVKSELFNFLFFLIKTEPTSQSHWIEYISSISLKLHILTVTPLTAKKKKERKKSSMLAFHNKHSGLLRGWSFITKMKKIYDFSYFPKTCSWSYCSQITGACDSKEIFIFLQKCISLKQLSFPYDFLIISRRLHGRLCFQIAIQSLF